MKNIHNDYKNFEAKKDHVVRTLKGRYGEYILISDLQKIMLKDAVMLLQVGEKSASNYMVKFAERLDTMW